MREESRLTEKTLEVRDNKNRDKRAEAEERQKYRNSIHNAVQMDRLNKRLGANVGAKRERERLLRGIK